MLSLSLANLLIVAALSGVLFTLVVIRVCQIRWLVVAKRQQSQPINIKIDGDRYSGDQVRSIITMLNSLHCPYRYEYLWTPAYIKFNNALGGYSGPKLNWSVVDPTEVANTPIIAPSVYGTDKGSDPREDDTRIMKIDSLLDDLKAAAGDESTQDLDPVETSNSCYHCMTELSGKDIFDGHMLCPKCRCEQCGLLNSDHTPCRQPCQ